MTETPWDEFSEQYGFSLRSVSWGYRESFAEIIQDLFNEGAIGAGKPEVTRTFFNLLKKADQSCYDHLLKDFLAALNPENRWLMDLPGIFSAVVDLGYRFSQEKFYFGNLFFRILGRGGLGRTPEEVRYLTATCNWLLGKDPRLAIAFADGFSALTERLSPEGIDRFVRKVWPIYTRSVKAASNYLSCVSKAAENSINSITKECRLEDISQRTHALLRALTGYDVQVSDLSGLDTDELLKRGISFVCAYQWCFVPASVREFSGVKKNRNWYLLLTVVAAGMLTGGSFSCLQGKPGYRSVEDLAGEDLVKVNLLMIVEYARIVRRICSQWPGAAGLIRFGIETEFTMRPPEIPVDRLFYDILQRRGPKELEKIVRASVNVFDTLDFITPELREIFRSKASHPLRSCSFLPDFRYPLEVSVPEKDRLAGELMRQAEKAKDERARRKRGEEDKGGLTKAEDMREKVREKETEEKNDAGEDVMNRGFLYHEWSTLENDYLENYCLLHERPLTGEGETRLPPEAAGDVIRVRRVFEQLKPMEASREKYLSQGDEINTDLLLEYLVDLRREPSPKVRFYQRPRINKRDLAVSILMDVSGSTGNRHGECQVMDLEKHAALVLAEGLKRAGDRFELCGFTSNGRKDCEYFLIKTIQQEWDRRAMYRLEGISPGNYTRIGAALRHTGVRLTRIAARQRLIILITDGKPMDRDYSPDNRYAQHDVRKACMENEEKGIHTFGISTEENTLDDMEVMFPRRRFTVLSDMRQLPRVLPKLYLRLTH